MSSRSIVMLASCLPSRRNSATASISERSISCPPGCQWLVDRRALRGEPGLERAGLLRRADRVALAGGDQHPRPDRRRLRRPGDQRMHQHRRVEELAAARRSRWRGCSRRSSSRARAPATARAAATCASTKAAIAAVRAREVGHVVAPLAQPAEEAQRAVLARRRRAARRSRRPASARAPAARTASRCRRCRGRRRRAAALRRPAPRDRRRSRRRPSCDRLQVLFQPAAQVRVLLRQLQRLAEMRGCPRRGRSPARWSPPRRARRPGVRK